MTWLDGPLGSITAYMTGNKARGKKCTESCPVVHYDRILSIILHLESETVSIWRSMILFIIRQSVRSEFSQVLKEALKPLQIFTVDEHPGKCLGLLSPNTDSASLFFNCDTAIHWQDLQSLLWPQDNRMPFILSMPLLQLVDLSHFYIASLLEIK